MIDGHAHYDKEFEALEGLAQIKGDWIDDNASDHFGDWLAQLPGDYPPFVEWVEGRGLDTDKLTDIEWSVLMNEYTDTIDPRDHRDFWEYMEF